MGRLQNTEKNVLLKELKGLKTHLIHALSDEVDVVEEEILEKELEIKNLQYGREEGYE